MMEALTVHDIASRYNLRRQARSWRGDCPACGYRGTFCVKEGRDGTPRMFCASCHDRDAIALSIGQQRPVAPTPQQEADREADRARKREAALRLWNGAEPAPGTPAATYLRARGIPHLASCPDLRFRGDTPHPEGGRLPALIALVRDSIGEPLAIHRTFLVRDGSGKADVDPQKASLGPVWGGAIRLAPLTAELVVGEGLETAAAAGVLTGLPA
jgi:hypothetical protein